MRKPGKMTRLATSICMVTGMLGGMYSLNVMASGELTNSEKLRAQIVSFEEAKVPAWATAKSGKLSMDSRYYINGRQGMRWDWQPGDVLELKLPEPFRVYPRKEASDAYGRNAISLFSAWLHNDQPMDETVRFEFGNGSGTNASFEMKLNFDGWRSPGQGFDRDMSGKPASTMDTVRIIAPNTAKGGTFYIDRLMVSIDDDRRHWSDYHTTTDNKVPEIDFGIPDNVPAATPEQLQDIQKIKTSLQNFYVGRSKLTEKSINKVREDFADTELKREDGVLTGRHVLTGQQVKIYQPKHLDADDKLLVKDYLIFRPYVELMLKIGQIYHKTDDAALKKEMADKFVMMSEHLYNQGFVAGSTLVTSHHWGYSGRDWYTSMFVMEDVLREAGLLDDAYDALMWYSREFKDSFDMELNKKSSNLDYFNTLSRQHLIMVLLEEDPDRRVALLNKFSGFVSGALAQTPTGEYDGLRPDGTAFRHRGNYPGYSFPAFVGMAHVAELLSGTGFELTPAARKNVKNAFMAARNYANPQIGMGISGRRPFKGSNVHGIKEIYRMLAVAGNAETGEPLDAELAATYLRLAELDETASVSLFGEKVMPEAMPQGHWSYNYGAFGVHRFADKMVTLKAFNKYVWSSEIYHNANRYGRYQSHGSAQIIPMGDQPELSRADKGFDENGWDWNRMPGATTIHLPLEKLDSPKKHTLMLRSEETFSGSGNLDNRYGAMGFKLGPVQDLKNIDSSFEMLKSVTAIDNRLVMAGSDISNDTEDHSTETTLFQHAINDRVHELWVNGRLVKDFPFQATLGQGDWLMDGHGNGYLIVSDSKVEVRRQHQKSRHNENKKPTEGDFSVAWVDHGANPDEAGYEYMVVLDATPEKMASLAKQADSGELPYKHEQKRNLHKTFDKATGVSSYVAFSSARPNDDYVVAIGTPSITLLKENGSGLDISVASTDINLTRETHSAPVKVNLTVKGAWKTATEMDNVKAVVKGSRTQLVVTAKDGIPVQFKLTQG
ncbi:chondroitinase family polysaccharide lyase [Endozoicomonas elysicola]|nr:chondroitinase family polysaccharide lyase [Endozoicomonas elysicola]